MLAGRMTIHFVLVVFLFGRTKLPLNVAPFASWMTSLAAHPVQRRRWRLPPFGTLMIVPPTAGAAGIVVFR